jgi:peptide deformylase
MKMGRGQEVVVVVNPEIIGRSGKKQMVEGCFSEGKKAIVKRSREITVNYTVLAQAQGEWYTSDVKLEKLEGWDARVFQHEYDHLRGVLICEKKGSKVIDND